MLVEIIIFIIFLFLFSYYKKTRKWTKFQARGIPFAKASYPSGSPHHSFALFGKGGSMSEMYQCYLNTPLAQEKIFGVYGHLDRDDCLMINDLELAKRILIKDFDHFVDRGEFGLKLDENDEIDKIFMNTFLMVKGDKWKTTRSILSPVFASGKMKLMFPLVKKIGENMEAFLGEQLNNDAEIDCKETFFRFALDSIATSGFGIELNTFQEPDHVFAKQVKEIQRAKGSESGSPFNLFKYILAHNIPIIKKIIDVPNFPRKGCLFLKNALMKTVDMRRDGSAGRRNDIIDLVIDELEKKNNTKQDSIGEDDYEKAANIDMSSVRKVDLDKEQVLVSNAFLLFGAALDTTSSTLTFAVHYLLKYPHYQDKIREEITNVVGEENNLTFESIQEMKFLDKFLYETLRNKHPFGHILERICTKDYLIPGTNYTVKKGEVVNFTMVYEKMKVENNSSFYNPAEFDPDNFDSSNNPDSFSFLAFGQGPRNCIGKRYAMMSMKIAIIMLLRKYKLIKTKNTQDDLKIYRLLPGADVPFKVQPL